MTDREILEVEVTVVIIIVEVDIVVDVVAIEAKNGDTIIINLCFMINLLLHFVIFCFKFCEIK